MVDAAKLAETTYQREKDAQEKLLQLIVVNKQQLEEGLNRHTAVLGKFHKDCAKLDDRKSEVNVEQHNEKKVIEWQQNDHCKAMKKTRLWSENML